MNTLKKKLISFAFMLPSLLGITFFFLLPFLETLFYSVSNTMGTELVGMKNFKLVFQNEAFLLASKNTARFISICIPLLLIISLIITIMIAFLSKKGEFFKTSFLIPMAIPVASIVLLWQLLFHKSGMLNGFLSGIGAQPIDFMNTTSAFWVLVFTYLWKNCGYHMILWFSGLGSISDSIYEAASMDGANAIMKFRYITLPALIPTLLLSTILAIINSFKVFREAYLVSGSYPHESIYMLQHLFNNWFLSLDIPKLSAGAVMLAIIISILTIFLLILWKRED